MSLTPGLLFAEGPQTLDRVVASIGSLAITASDVEQEYRLERLLNGQWPAPPANSASLASAREHLTYQILLTREENPGPTERAESEQSAAELLTALDKQFPNRVDLQRALQQLGMTDKELADRVAQQELMLRMIEQRLRPAASPSDEAVADYYRSAFVPEFQSKNGGATAPPLPEVEGQIREVLVQKRMNELLDRWIEELKPTTNVRFHSF